MRGLFIVKPIKPTAVARATVGGWFCGQQLAGDADRVIGEHEDFGDAVETMVEDVDSWAGGSGLPSADLVTVLAALRSALWNHGAVILPGWLVGEHRGDVVVWVKHKAHGYRSEPATLECLEVITFN